MQELPRASTPILPRNPTPEPSGAVRVWDGGVRVFHWALVVAVSSAALTGFVLGDTVLAWHEAAAAVAWRVVWGLLGTTYARFSSFAYSPAVVLAYLQDLWSGRPRRHLGHNPLGAMMVFALLAVVAAIAMSGALALGGLLKQGPLRAFLSYDIGRQALRLHRVLSI